MTFRHFINEEYLPLPSFLQPIPNLSKKNKNMWTFGPNHFSSLFNDQYIVMIKLGFLVLTMDNGYVIDAT